MPNNEILIIFFLPLLAGLIPAFLNNLKLFKFKPIISFAGGVLFASIIMHLLPELYEFNTAETHGGTLIPLCILLGFYFQMVLEKFISDNKSKIHDHDHEQEHSHVHGGSVLVLLLLGFCVHSLMEGMAIHTGGHDHGGPSHTNQSMYMGILLHKIPAAFALSAFLFNAQLGKLKVIFLLLLFCSMTPLGIYLADQINTESNSWVAAGYIYAFIAGAVLHIALAILLEQTEHDNLNVKKLIAAVVGSLLVVVLNF